MTTETHDDYRIDRGAESSFRIIRQLDYDAVTVGDFLRIAEARGYTREWAAQKWQLRQEELA